MYLSSIVSFVCVLVYLFFGLNVYRINPSSRLNRLFLVLCVNYAISAFFSMLQYSALSQEACQLWNAWHLPFSFLNVGLLLHFHIDLCATRKVPVAAYVLTYLPSAYFMAYQLSGRAYLSDFLLGPCGWYPKTLAATPVTMLNIIIFSVFFALELVLLISYAKRSRSRRIKKQARTLVIAMTSSFAATTVYNTLTLGRGLPMPLLPFATQLIWIAGIWYALVRYGFMGISLSFASKQIVSHVNEMLALCDQDGNVMEANDRFGDIAGLRPDAVKPLPLDAVFAGDGFASLSSRLLSGAVDRGSAEATLLAASGEPVPVRVNASSLRDSVGDVEGLAIVAEDMRAYRKLEELNARNAALLEEKRILLAEVHHRIKNNMSTIRAVLNLQMESTRDERARETLADAESRVLSMAVLYDKLYRSEGYRKLSGEEYLSPLIDEVLANFPNAGIVNVRKSIGDFTLAADTLLPLGIVINEILTNAMKHAFAGRETGNLDISADASGARVLIEIADDGPGIPASFDLGESTGFGLTMIRAMTDQLGGSLSVSGENGTKYVLEFNAGGPSA